MQCTRCSAFCPQRDPGTPKIAQVSLSIFNCKSLTATEGAFKSRFVLRRAIYSTVYRGTGTTQWHKIALPSGDFGPKWIAEERDSCQKRAISVNSGAGHCPPGSMLSFWQTGCQRSDFVDSEPSVELNIETTRADGSGSDDDCPASDWARSAGCGANTSDADAGGGAQFYGSPADKLTMCNALQNQSILCSAVDHWNSVIDRKYGNHLRKQRNKGISST